MYIFTPNTLIKSAEVNANNDELSARLDVLETTYVRSVLGSSFSTTASATFQDTGLDVTLPDAGTWLVVGRCRISKTSTSGSFGVARLYNETTSTAITNSDTIGIFTSTSTVPAQVTTPLIDIVTTTTANNVIRVDLKPALAEVIQLLADTNGYSILIAKRLA